MESKSLATKLAIIGKEIGTIAKSGTNKEQKYKFIEYAVVAGCIREFFEKYHVIIIPSVESYTAEPVTSANGRGGFHYLLTMQFMIINGDQPDDVIVRPWISEATDFGDKGVNKAITSGTKYFLMRLFNVSEKSDEDADAVTPEIEPTGGSRVFDGSARLDFDDLREQLSVIDDLQSVDEFAVEVAKKFHLTDKQKDSVKRIFDQRRKELKDAK